MPSVCSTSAVRRHPAAPATKPQATKPRKPMRDTSNGLNSDGRYMSAKCTCSTVADAAREKPQSCSDSGAAFIVKVITAKPTAQMALAFMKPALKAKGGAAASAFVLAASRPSSADRKTCEAARQTQINAKTANAP